MKISAVRPLRQLIALFLIATPLAALAAAGTQEGDLRSAYDVAAYDLELAVRPAEKVLEGVCRMQARVLADELRTCVIDLNGLHEVLGVSDGNGNALEFERREHSLAIRLATALSEGASFEVRVHYRGKPEGGRFDGFHWAASADGRPWINTACQGLGAHYWYPCKASYFHPEDKPERVSMAITCPADLYGVSNGRLLEIVDGAPSWFAAGEDAWKTYRWRHDYPLETYAVTLNVGPYVVVEDTLQLPDLEEPLPYIYYVLPENAEKAALQFQDVPELLTIYSRAFGSFPFPKSKFALVETNFWGMEHSTAVAYGSSYPAWCEREGVEDPYAARNRWFDYILVHEVAHEWWGNAVSAQHWGHFWIHEGFGTYAEGVYVEETQGREAADRWFEETARRIPGTEGRLYRGDHPQSGEAYAGLIYSKGACVLNTARHYMDHDLTWWRCLKDFNLSFRYGNASTEDFQRILEKDTRRSWSRFFKDWVYGEGTPALQVTFSYDEEGTYCDVVNSRGSFYVPLDVAWTERGPRRVRFWVEPGEHRFEIPCAAPPPDLQAWKLDRVLGEHTVTHYSLEDREKAR